jgi:hypothetical protein
MPNDSGRPIDLPANLDSDKLAETALAILSLTLHGGSVWKALDWNLMNLLHQTGWIADPISKNKSVALTAEGERLARFLLLKHFGKVSPDRPRSRR